MMQEQKAAPKKVQFSAATCVRVVAGVEKDGFKIWICLVNFYLPNSEQRTRSLGQTLEHSMLNSKTSLLAQILNLDKLIRLDWAAQYESSSGNTYPGDLKAATILRCSLQRVRQYL